MIKLPEFIKQNVERAIHDAMNPKGMHTNGPCMASIEVTQLQRLLLIATQELVIGVDCLDDHVTCGARLPVSQGSTAVVVMSRVNDVTTVTGQATVQRGKSGMISF